MKIRDWEDETSTIDVEIDGRPHSSQLLTLNLFQYNIFRPDQMLGTKEKGL